MNAIDIARFLSDRHTHGDIAGRADPEGIYYAEEDVIELLRLLGHPAPDWDSAYKKSEESE